MEIITIQSARELPLNTDFVLYEPPFMGDELEEITREFIRKYKHEPQIIYRLNKSWYVVKKEEDKSGISLS